AVDGPSGRCRSGRMDACPCVEADRAARHAHDSRRPVSAPHASCVAQLGDGRRHHRRPPGHRPERPRPVRFLTLPPEHDGRMRISGEAGQHTMSAAGRLSSARPVHAPAGDGCATTDAEAGMSTTAGGSGSPIRVAVIGFGAAGMYFHSPFVAATPGLRLTTIVTSDAARAAQAQSEYPEVTIRAKAADLWTAGDVDLVVVAAPNVAHVPLAVAAIEAGIPVVVDKPLAVTAGEARRLVAFARDRKVPLTVY